jgi:hypothetical protein
MAGFFYENKNWVVVEMTSVLWAVGRLGPVLLMGLLLSACGSVAPPPSGRVTQAPDSWEHAGWQHWPLPGKQATNYKSVLYGERAALEVRASSSASLMRRPLNLAAADLGAIRFSWKVPVLLPQADLAQRDKADAVVRVVLTFEGDRSRLAARDHMLSELALLMTGEPLPYATLMYVWCPTREPGSVIVNPRTDRIRKLVVESGTARLNQWLDYERDIRADYRRVFGEEPGRLLNVAVMSDGDNTRSTFRAWYGPVQVEGLAVASGD